MNTKRVQHSSKSQRSEKNQNLLLRDSEPKQQTVELAEISC